jgi:Mrp family chromosome partitioning ATPase
MTKKVLICSGKGGVGKTTVAVELAKSLEEEGFKIGLVDADIDGPNIPEFTNIHQEVSIGEKIKPVIRNNMEIISLGFMIRDTDFVAWPSDRRAMAVQQLVENIDWSNDLDYMIIDTPPGTSDEVEYVAGYFKPEYVFVISTPHDASISDVKRTIGMLNNFKSKIKGIVFNMCVIKCPKCGEIVYSKEVPESIMDIPVIAELPYTTERLDVSEIVDIILEDRV